jgi:hypothetical protein
MAILSPTDLRPVYIDSLGRPASSGRLIFWDRGTTTLKSIYLDEARTVLAPNPQQLDSAGRTEFQVFYGQGDYTVQLDYLTGTVVGDINEIPSAYWTPDHQWEQSGQPAPPSFSNTVYQIQTIADLRLADPVVNPVVQVLYYASTGDCYPRTYTWVTGAPAVDNGGQSIKVNALSSGAYIMQPTGDCREWGVLPGGSTSLLSQMQVMSNYFASATSGPRGFYMPAGAYRVAAGTWSVACPMEVYKGATFYHTSGSFNIVCTDAFQADLGSSLQSGPAGVYLSLNDPKLSQPVVSPRWWDNGLPTVPSAWMTQMYNRCAPGYTAKISSPMDFLGADSSSVTIKHALEFSDSAYFNTGAQAGSVTFEKGVTVTAPGSAYNLFRGTMKYVFLCPFHTQWLVADDTQITVDLGAALTTLASYNTLLNVVYDAYRSKFTTGYNTYDSVKHIYSSGTIAATIGYNVYLPGVSGLTSDVLSGPIILKSGTTLLTYWGEPPQSPSQIHDQWAFAMSSACLGNGSLDLENNTIRVGTQYSFAFTAGKLTVANGTLDQWDTNVIPIVLGAGAGTVDLDNLKVSSKSSNTTSLFKATSGSSISSFTVNNCTHSSVLGTAFIGVAASVSKFAITNSSFSSYALHSGYAASAWDIDKSTLSCLSALGDSSPRITKCNISTVGSVDFDLGCSTTTFFSDNKIQCPLRLKPKASWSILGQNGAAITGIVHHNTFVGSAAVIKVAADLSRTLCRGLSIIGNVFEPNNGTNVTYTGFIITNGSGWESALADYHNLVIADNYAAGGLVPRTRGSVEVKVSFVTNATYAFLTLDDGYNASKFFKIPNCYPNLWGAVSPLVAYYTEINGLLPTPNPGTLTYAVPLSYGELAASNYKSCLLTFNMYEAQ